MRTLPWDTTSVDIPWRVFTDILEQWTNQPTYLIGEYVIIACAVAALIHARHSGRAHLLIWFGALVAGTANDLFFMALPLVDNFWQAQASIMLTPRLPLYIPCVYVVFMYWPTVAIRRLGLPRWSTVALTGIVACLFYAPYDIVGAKFLWWTWHDSDALIGTRFLGAPVSSSLWVLTFAGSFALLLDMVLRRGVTTGKLFTIGFASVAILTTPLMMLQMTVLQTLDGGTPGFLALSAGLAIYGFAALSGRHSAQRDSLPVDRVGLGAVAIYLVMLTTNMTFFDPKTHVSTGLHQVPGPCDVTETDITGVTRQAFLCVDEFEEPFTFDCTTRPENGTKWFTICGKAHTSYVAYVSAVGGLVLASLAIFTLCLGALGRRAGNHSLVARRNIGITENKRSSDRSK